METKNNRQAFKPTHPGEVLHEELRERGITQKAFAEQIGMRPSHLSEIINGKRNITISIADKLQEALGIDSQSWVNMQTQYDYAMKGCASDKEEVTLQVLIEDASMLADIKRAISLLKGVRRVALL